MSTTTHRSPIAQLLVGKRVILGSASPRRIALLQALGLEFEVRPADIDESFGTEIEQSEVPLYLAMRKSEALKDTLKEDELLITADTIVLLNGEVIGKPNNIETAKKTLSKLSGNTHTVVTGYCIHYKAKKICGKAESQITFKVLTEEEIEYYVTHDEVLDKAGAYGIQDWIGLVGVEEIHGSYNNIMGLPTTRIYKSIVDLLS